MKDMLRCPICRTFVNRDSKPFASVWAVTCHVASMIDARDPDHSAWARQHFLKYELRGWALGHEIEQAVRRAVQGS